ncbi:MAG: nucleotidyltransferase domain-containing protein [Clostridia bacterium]|nr:nucleotidyltransferase domain-containing protein [Clostridia bacterium]
MLYYLYKENLKNGIVMNKKIYTIEEIKAILEEVLKNSPVYSVILFGSYAKEIADENSDIDLIIDTKETLMGFKLFSLITKIEDAFNKQVDAFEKSEIIENSKIDEEIKRTGIVVYKNVKEGVTEL